MASQEHPLHEILVGTEAFVLSRPSNSGPKLAYSSDTGVLFFLDGNDWYEFTGGATMVASSSSSNSSSRSSRSSESSSNSSAKREIYPDDILHETTLTALSTDINIYTAIRLTATLRQIYDINVSYLELTLVGLFFYNGPIGELTTAGSYVPLKGSFAVSEDAGVDPKFLMSPATGFIAELETENYDIVITDKNYQTISFDKIPTDYVLNNTKVLTATASSGLPITYVSSDPSIASVTGSVLTYVDPSGGTVTITASQAGNANFDPANDVSHSFIIRPPYCIYLPPSTASAAKGINVPYSAIQEVSYTMMWWQRLGDPTAANDPTYQGPLFRIDQGNDMMTVKYDGGVYGTRVGQGNTPMGNANGYTVTWDQWQHFAITRDVTSGNIDHYLDGVHVFQNNTYITTAGHQDNPLTSADVGQCYQVPDDKTINGTANAGGLLNGKKVFYMPNHYLNGIFFDGTQWILTDSTSNNGGLYGGQTWVWDKSNNWIGNNSTDMFVPFDPSNNNSSVAWAAETTLEWSSPQNAYLGRNQYGLPADELNPGAPIGYRLGGQYSAADPTWEYGSYFNDWAIWDGSSLTAAEVAAIHANGMEHIAPPSLIMGTQGGPTSYFRMGDDDFPQSKQIRNVGNRPAPQRATIVGPGGESTADFAELLDQAIIIPIGDI